MWTAIVGMLAIMVSTIFNIYTLKRSGENLALAQKSFDAAEERARIDRGLVHQQQLRAAIADIVTCANHWATQISLCARMLDRYAAAPGEGKSSAEIEQARASIIDHSLTRVRPAARDLFRALVVADLLTKNQELTDKLHTVRHAMFRVSTVISEGGPTKPPDQVAGVSEKLDELRGVSNAAVDKLYKYAAERLALDT